MNKLALGLLFVAIILACVFEESILLGEKTFPLKQVSVTSVEERIEEIAVGNTWIALQSPDSIIALDLLTQTKLWSLDVKVNKFKEGFNIVNDILITASEDEVFLLNKLGERTALDIDSRTIIRIVGANVNFLYVVTEEWILQAYDISQNTLLWKLDVGRTIGRVYYNPSNNIAFITSDDFIRAYDNSSGKLLWEMGNVYGQGTLFESGILYVPVPTAVKNSIRIAAIDGANQEILWERQILHSAEISVSASAVANDFLVYAGYGMIIVDKNSGEPVWIIPSVDEEFYDVPAIFDNVLYMKGKATGTVHAISLRNGSVIGHTRSQVTGYAEVSGRIFVGQDGILFSTKNSIIKYGSKQD